MMHAEAQDETARPAAAPAAPAAPTPVVRVATVILCGIVIALNVGKMPPALPDLRGELMLGLVAAGLVVSALNVVGAVSGGAVGVLVDRWGPRRMLGAALLAAAAGNFIGAASPSAAVLLLGRLCEGIALILTLSAAPVLLQRLSAAKDRGLVMGFWGTFLPVGSAIAILAAPGLLGHGGWRLIWLAAGGLSLAAAGLLWLVEARAAEPPGGGAARLADLARVLRTPAVLWIGVAFGAFSFAYIGVLSFLPTWLIETQGLTLGAASAATIVYALCNAMGNIIGGMLLRRGVPAPRLIAIAAATTGVVSLLMFLPAAPEPLRLPAAILFGAVGGWIPVSVFATAPRLAPEPRLAGAAMGVTVQLLNAGTLLGPVVLAGVVDATGTWGAAPFPLVLAAVIALAAGLAITRDVAAIGRN